MDAIVNVAFDIAWRGWSRRWRSEDWSEGEDCHARDTLTGILYVDIEIDI